MSSAQVHDMRTPKCANHTSDLTDYGKIVVALKETIRLMAEIDEVIPSWPVE